MLIMVAEGVDVTGEPHGSRSVFPLPASPLSVWSANCHLCLALYFTKLDNKTISLPAEIFADYLKIPFPEKVLLFLTTPYFILAWLRIIQRLSSCIFATFKNALWAIELS